MKKLFLFFTLFFLICVSSLFASNKIIWTWEENDPKVAWYRYQINQMDESETAWTYLENIPSKRYVMIKADSSITEYVLYIQASYDGINWSESARSIVSTDAFQR